MKTFVHSGHTGDIIFSLPTIKAMGGGTLLIHNFHKQRYNSVKSLLEAQTYIDGVAWVDTKPSGVVDLDKFREHAGNYNNLVECHFKGQGLNPDEHQWWRDGWLTLPHEMTLINGIKYSLINRTTNYADPHCDWNKEVDYLKSISDEVYFIGYPEEYAIFNCIFNRETKYFTCNFLEAAYLMKKAVIFTGCYSALSTVAMGLGIPYRLEQAPGHTCSSLLMPRETIINA